MSKKLKRDKILYLKINSEVKAQFKSFCAKRQRSMTEVIEKMMLEKIAMEK